MALGDLHSKSKKELQALARQVGISGSRLMTKKKLLTKLWGAVNHDAFTSASEPTSPVVESHAEQRVEEAKYQLRETPAEGIAHEAEIGHPPGGEFPTKYGDDRIVLLVRDPLWVFAYWEITAKRLASVMAAADLCSDGTRKALRIYRVDESPEKEQRMETLFDIEINDGADNWYIRMPAADRSYCVEIGLLASDGRFLSLACSNVVTTPRIGMSEVLDEAWMSRPAEYERMYALSGGLRLGDSSLEMRERMEQLLQQELASGVAASGGMWSGYLGRKERGFRFQVHTELIVYGSTEPDATVSWDGCDVPLRADGTFSFRVALPDGRQTIPLTAKSSDGIEERAIVSRVDKSTRAHQPIIREAVEEGA